MDRVATTAVYLLLPNRLVSLCDPRGGFLRSASVRIQSVEEPRIHANILA